MALRKRIALIALPVIVAIVALAVILTREGEDKVRKHNTDYIQSLNYDLNELLAVDLTPKQIDPIEPGESREHRSGEVGILVGPNYLIDISSKKVLN